MKPTEQRVIEKDNSWKMELVDTIQFVLKYAKSNDKFIGSMSKNYYDVKWQDNPKHIIYTCPNGMKCRDNKLYYDMFLKENMETLFEFRGYLNE